jgi:hypothetical protein
LKTAALPRTPRRVSPGWQWLQACSVALASALVATLFLDARLGLFLMWNVLVPVVPGILLFAPQVWRNLCPIAVVHQLPATFGRRGRRRIPSGVQKAAPALAMGLLFVIVPLRLLLFNESGAALAVFILVVLAVALMGGLFVTGKGGWCATLCPVLPVERLYGQSPMSLGPLAHCAVCTGCLRSCYDLKPERSLHELLTPGRATRTIEAGFGLQRTPMGLFAAAFPGFVLGYFTAPPHPSAQAAYLWTWGGALAAGALLLALQHLARWNDRFMARGAATLADTFYYWFSVPAVAMAVNAPAAGVGAARVAALLLVGIWAAHAFCRRAVNAAHARATGSAREAAR